MLTEKDQQNQHPHYNILGIGYPRNMRIKARYKGTPIGRKYCNWYCNVLFSWLQNNLSIKDTEQLKRKTREIEIWAKSIMHDHRASACTAILA